MRRMSLGFKGIKNGAENNGDNQAGDEYGHIDFES